MSDSTDIDQHATRVPASPMSEDSTLSDPDSFPATAHSPGPRAHQDSSDDSDKSRRSSIDHASLSSQIKSPIIPVAPPLPPSLPLPKGFLIRKQKNESTLKLTRGIHDTGHVCSNGKAYPPYSEFIKFGRINSEQDQQYTRRFEKSSDWHCKSHFLSEAIYKISNRNDETQKSTVFVIEDFPPLARDQIDSEEARHIEQYIQQRQKLENDRRHGSSFESNALRTAPKREWKKPPSNDLTTLASSSDRAPVQETGSLPPPYGEEREPSLHQNERSTLPDVSRARPSPHAPEPQTPPLQRTADNQLPVGQQAVIHAPQPLPRHLTDFKHLDTVRNMLQASSICRIPSTFRNVRLNFLFHLHMTLYDIHLLRHRRTSSYPKPCIFDDLKYGREVCDFARDGIGRIRNERLFLLFQKWTFSVRSERVRENSFFVPILRPRMDISPKLMFEAMRALHSEFELLYKSEVGIDSIPPFA